MKTLLIVDDEKNMLHMLEALLEPSGYAITTCDSPITCLELIENHSFDIVLSDIKMPEMDGLELLKNLKQKVPRTSVIMMSAFGTIRLAIKSLQLGADDFISKPFKRDEVLLSLKKVEHRIVLNPKDTKKNVIATTTNKVHSFGDLIYSHQSMVACITLAQKASIFPVNVCISGESGTGKEVLAKAIHNTSERKGFPFVPINCSSISPELIESELYGHTKGSFTGATESKTGLLESANNGTIFLDEIGDMPMTMQLSLLRVLQEGEVRPVGQNRPTPIDVRIITATSKDLSEEINIGNFREDLFYRINVLPIFIPPLRDRHSDIAILIDFFLQKSNTQLGTSVKTISEAAYILLNNYNWPGNVRELENIIQRCVILTNSSQVKVEHLPDEIKLNDGSEVNPPQSLQSLANVKSLKSAKNIIEPELIIKALKKTKGNKSQAAKLLEISYPALLQKIKFYKI